MRRMMDLIAMTIGGWAGWAIGAPISIFTAFVISMVGTGFGLWASRKYMGSMLP